MPSFTVQVKARSSTRLSTSGWRHGRLALQSRWRDATAGESRWSSAICGSRTFAFKGPSHS